MITDAPWLTVEQQQIWRAYLSGVSRINERLDTELRPFGLDIGEYEILVNLSEADQLEMRVYWQYTRGAFLPGQDWKRTFSLEKMRATYYTPLIMRRLDEVERR